ncbi:MAG: FIST signal transduction protein [Candidatus Sumerlaeaceae bacterium]
MTSVATAFSSANDSATAGAEIGKQLLDSLENQTPDAVIVFASSRYEYSPLIEGIMKQCNPGVLVGCSSAGEFVTDARAEGAVSAMGIKSNQMAFRAGLARNLRENTQSAALQLVGQFGGLKEPQFGYRSALLLTDALAGQTEELITELTALTGGAYAFFGGGAGDDAHFSRTVVFSGNEVATDAVAGLEILSKKPLGIGVSHGWEPATSHMRVTESQGMRLISLNSIPAAEVFEEHAKETGQNFDRADPVPFFLHNVLGIATPDGYKLRVPLSVNEDGSILCASDVPEGSQIAIMKTGTESAAEAARRAAEAALEQTNHQPVRAAIFFDCVATRLRLGQAFQSELDSLRQTLGTDTMYVGCNSYGQIARVDNQFCGFHNCTAVVCVLPE